VGGRGGLSTAVGTRPCSEPRPWRWRWRASSLDSAGLRAARLYTPKGRNGRARLPSEWLARSAPFQLPGSGDRGPETCCRTDSSTRSWMRRIADLVDSFGLTGEQAGYVHRVRHETPRFVALSPVLPAWPRTSCSWQRLMACSCSSARPIPAGRLACSRQTPRRVPTSPRRFDARANLFALPSPPLLRARAGNAAYTRVGAGNEPSAYSPRVSGRRLTKARSTSRDCSP
jgi:hypothetical protein